MKISCFFFPVDYFAYAFLAVTPRMMKGAATVMAADTGRQMKGLGTKPASRKDRKEMTATVMA